MFNPFTPVLPNLLNACECKISHHFDFKLESDRSWCLIRSWYDVTDISTLPRVISRLDEDRLLPRVQRKKIYIIDQKNFYSGRIVNDM